LNYSNLLINVLVGLLFGTVLSPIATRVARKIQLIDDPQSSPRKIHNKPTPCAGGMVLFFGLVIAILLKFTGFDGDIIKIIAAGSIVFITGLIDDHKSITVFQKFLGQFAATTVMILLGIHVQIFEGSLLPFQLSNTAAFILDIVITYLWVIGLSNAFNFIDSMDGLVIQLSQIAVVLMGISAITYSQPGIALMMIFLLGMLIAMSVFNSYPAIYFLGDSGSLFLGFILSAISILLNPVDLPQASSWFFPIMFFTVPLFDMFLVVFSRIRHKVKFYKASTDHTYHRLCRLGLSNFRAIEVMKLESIFWSILGMVAIYQTPLIANILFGLFLINFIVSFIYLDSSKKANNAEDRNIFYGP